MNIEYARYVRNLISFHSYQVYDLFVLVKWSQWCSYCTFVCSFSFLLAFCVNCHSVGRMGRSMHLSLTTEILNSAHINDSAEICVRIINNMGIYVSMPFHTFRIEEMTTENNVEKKKFRDAYGLFCSSKCALEVIIAPK